MHGLLTQCGTLTQSMLHGLLFISRIQDKNFVHPLFHIAVITSFCIVTWLFNTNMNHLLIVMLTLKAGIFIMRENRSSERLANYYSRQNSDPRV